MHTYEMLEKEIKKLPDEQIDLLYDYVTKLNANGSDTIFAEKNFFDGIVPIDSSLNHCISRKNKKNSFLDFAMEHDIDAPSDWSVKVDEYLYGTIDND